MNHGRGGEPTLDEVRAEYPRWRCYKGINGLYYGELPGGGQRVSGEDPLDLRDQLKRAESRPGQDRPPRLPGRLWLWLWL